MAKYTTVGPFAFKRSTKKPNSVRALKPVQSPSEARRAFAQTGAATQRRRDRAAAKRAADREARQQAIRAYFGLNKRGYGAKGNPLEDLLSRKQRLTTPQERSQTVSTGKHYVETPKGFAVIGDQKIRPFGITTRDEVGENLRRQAKEDREYRARGKQLEQDRARLERVTTADMYNRLTGKKPASAGTGDAVKSAASQLKSITKELDTRAKNERKTEAEGFFQVLNNISRPYYGVNAGLKAAVKGERPDHVLNKVGKGLRLKDRTESWDVLDAAGVHNKAVKYGLGIPAAVATDPLTYVSIGAAPESGGASLAALGPKASKIAELLGKSDRAADLARLTGKSSHARAAAKASKAVDDFLSKNKVLRGPLTEADAIKVAERHRGLSTSIGARVPFTQKFVGVKTSGRTTANLRNRFSHEATRGYRNDYADKWVEHMAPTGRIASLTRDESDTAVRSAAKKNAATTTAGVTRKTTQRSLDAAIRSELGIGRLRRILRPRAVKRSIRAESARLAERYDAGEDIGKIGDYLDDLFAKQLKRERDAGLDTSEFHPREYLENGVPVDGAQKYLPRYWIGEITKRGHRAEKKIRNIESAKHVPHSATNPQTEFAEMRTDPRALKDIPDLADSPRQFVRDISGVAAKREQDSLNAVAAKEVNDAIVATGRRAKAGESTKGLPTGFSIYKYDKGTLERVSKDAVPEGSTNHYIIKDAVKNRVDELTGGAGKGVPAGKAFDRITGHWKGSVTVAWPGYYLRNLIGDTMLARQAGTDARSYRQSMKISKAIRKRDKIIRKGEQITKGKDPDEALKKLSFKINGKTYTGKELEDLATEHAAISTGQHGSEVTQLVGADSFAANNRLARMNIRRENLPRRATFIADMKRGSSGEKAGEFARKEHYDYGTRTEFQKQARRVIPFFAWWDLNTRKQLRMLATRPGRTNEIYHVMNGAASAAGYKDYRDYLGDLPKGKQRGLPIPIVYGFEKDGTPKIKDVQFGNVLSELRTVLNLKPSKWGDELLSRGNPIITKPAELGMNHSGFFRDQIEPDYAPFTKAPKFLAGAVGKGGKDTLPEKLLNTEIVMKLDRKTGKQVPMYRKKTDYAIRSAGPWASFLLGLTNSSGRFNKSPVDQAMGLSGLSPSTHDSNQGKLDELYAQRGALQKIYDGLGHVRGGKIRRKGLTKRIDALTNEISKVEKASGYKVPLNTQGGKKGKKKAGFDLFGSAGGGAEQKFDLFGGADKKEEKFDLFGTNTPKSKPKPTVQSRVNKISDLNQSQKNIVAEIISIGKKRGVPQKHIVAALETGRVESNFANSARMTDHDSQGWRQERASIYKNPTNLKASINRFYDETAEADRKGMSAGDLAAAVQRPAAQYRGRYAQHEGEAKAIMARVRGAAAPSLKGDGQKIAKKYDLKITSTWRSKAHNAAVGGVPNSYHTRGSKNHPEAMDLVGSAQEMARAAKAFQAKGYSTLIHNAGSGVHLHVQDDHNVGGLGSGGDVGGGGGSYSGGTPTYSNASQSQPNGSTAPSTTNPEDSKAAQMMMLLEYLSSKDKKSATKKLVRQKALGQEWSVV